MERAGDSRRRAPPIGGKHRAWWTGDRPHVHAWRTAGFTISDLVLGQEVTFLPATHASAFRGTPTVSTPQRADVLLVGCVKTKTTVPAAAKDLYRSPLFRHERRFAETTGAPWYILSAEYGLVAPDEWISPYERYLPATPPAYRSVWGMWVTERLEMLIGSLCGKFVEIHAGEPYVRAVMQPLATKGATVTAPLTGLSMGRRMQWYGARRDDTDIRVAHAADPMITTLLDDAAAVTPAQFLASERAALSAPGLYSWWVDDRGGAELSTGLGITIPAGLIYAGLADATRWPSGKRSSNTLWSRIAGMHLGGRHEFSTFRRTLGSILAAANGNATIDEEMLTGWMGEHLLVRTAVHHDADALGRLEADVLRALDPPLNLQRMTPTPIRSRVKQLRKKYGNT